MGALYGLIFDVDGVIADTEAVNARASIKVFADLFGVSGVVRSDFEAALSDSFIFKGSDNCFKDIASIHGTYRKVTETIPAVELIGIFLEEAEITNVLWLLDSPVSNSAKLKQLIAKIAAKYDWNWQVELSQNPDRTLIETDSTAATSDGIILDNCKSWLNLAAEIIKQKLTSVEVIDLSAVSQ